MVKYFTLQEPITKISAVILGRPTTLELPLGKSICHILLGLTVTASATGAATKTIPRPSWGMNEIRFKLGNVNRSRRAVDLFGIGGLNSLNEQKSSGTVQYTQGGVLITVAYGGRTIGNEPVLIDSLEDIALQAALANNTATVGLFMLPLCFSEPWRTDPAFNGDSLALPTAFDNGTVLGTPYVEADVPLATAVAGTMTAVAISGSLVYNEQLVKAGSVVRMVKQKIHQKIYDVGDIELGDNFDTKDTLQRFSIVTVSDKISKIVVKRGSRILRQVSFAENHCAALCYGINGNAARSNRYDMELDLNDDPDSALPLERVAALSVLATFATANDNPKNCLILADYYGPVE